jgi:D-3-phosphoglycerate dehydrogenase / 2-oxoglutarate reductase
VTHETSFPKDRIKVLLLENVHPSAHELFRSEGFHLETVQGALGAQELAARIEDVHIIGIRSKTRITEEALAKARRLLAVGCFCIGTNQVALDAAQLRGVPVFNAPYSNTRSVAELVIAEAILLMRRIPEKNMECHRGGWSKSASGSFEVRGKTLGIVGYGHIGTQVGVLAESLGMRVIYSDIETKLALGNAMPAASLNDLLERSDIVSLHVPETVETKNMFGAAEIARMKKGAVLINASRGTVVDIDALAAGLRSKHVGGAAVDVFPVEPKANDERFVSPLVGMDNVILTPHVGGSTLEAQENIGLEVAAKLVRYSDNGSTLSAVNFPEVSLPGHSGSRRLLHIHHNVPGVLSRINEAFSKSGVNIDAQFLQTSGKVGYVVIDVTASEEQAQGIKDDLAAIQGTVRTRLLY